MSPISVTFEAPLLADAVAKAARVAPVKGAAFDKAAGIVLDIYPDHAVIMATDLETTYRQELAVTEVVGVFDPIRWRLPSVLLSNLLSALPMGNGSTVRMVDKDDSTLRILSGATVAKVSLYAADDYPTINKFPTDGMAEANDLAARLATVSWAVKRKVETPLGGVHIDGDLLVATDGMMLATIPCKAPVEEPVTVAVNNLAFLLKSATDVRLRAEDLRLCMTLDAETQATTRIYSGAYPNYKALFRDDYIGDVQIHRLGWIEVIQRMLTVIDSDKFPHLSIEVNGDRNRLIMDIVTQGGDRIRDEVSFTGNAPSSTILGTNANSLLPALQATNREMIRYQFGHSDPLRCNMVPHVLSDDSGYVAIVSAKVDTKK